MSDATVVRPIDNILPTSDNLPEGWSEGALKECSTVITKGTTPTTHGYKYQTSGIPFIRIENLLNGRIDLGSITTFIGKDADDALRRSRLESGDLLFSIAGTIGRAALVRASDVPANTNQAIAIIRGTHSLFLHQFLLFALTSVATQRQASEEARGGAMNNISLDDVRSLRLPIPPMCEQERIVRRVEELFSHVNSARDHLSRVPAILKRFCQAVLAAACSGRLTEDWREHHTNSETGPELLDKIRKERRTIWATQKRKNELNYPAPQLLDVRELPDIPERWIWTSLDEVVQEGRPIIYGIIKPGPHVSDGIPYVRVIEMEDGRLVDPTRLRRASRERAAKFSRATLAAGDVLISKDGTIGRVSVVPPELTGGNITQHLVRAAIHQFVDTWYAVAAIRSAHSQQWLVGELKGVALQGVNVRDFRRLPIPLPPVDEQHEIVQRLERLFMLADTIDKRVKDAARRAEKLTQSILTKAFRGELVPTEAELARREGREYEPASVLLERIKRERESHTFFRKSERQPKRPKIKLATAKGSV
jgi:type I restriction enzyme S subunit